jgi:uncharacterized protein YciW
MRKRLMTPSLSFLFGLCLLAASCEKSDQAAATPNPSSASPRATKSTRPERLEAKEAKEQRQRDLQQAAELPEGPEREQTVAQLVWDSIELDPEFSREAFARLTPGGDEKNRLIQHYALRLAEQDPDEAARWAASLETEEEKSLAFGRVAIVISEKDPELAARILSDSGVAGREFDTAVVEVIQRWSAESPQNAADWVSRFDPGEARKAGLKSITTTWMTIDPEASLAWLASLRDASARQEAITGYAQSAMEQPGMIQEEMLRHATPEMLSALERLKTEALEQEIRAAEEAEAAGQEN